MRGYDAFAGVIKSGGKTRRAAKMVILNADHPDIEEFINSKADEEKKAWALIDAGYDGSFNVRGGAYDSVFFQNANHSVRVTDEFMRAVVEDRDWHDALRARRASRARPTSARDLMKQMAEAAWQCGDPGMQFDTTINDWHTCPNTARINASNPCSEYMFLDDTACNLASLNLMKFRSEDGEFDVEAFKRRLPHDDHRAGDPGRQRQLPDAGDRPEQPRLPAAGPRLREPGRAADGPRPALRLRRRPRLRGGGHRADARRGLRAERARGRGHGPLRRLREERRADAARDRQAPAARAHDRLHAGAARAAAQSRARRCGTRPTRWACSTATATARSRCWRPPAPSAS